MNTSKSRWKASDDVSVECDDERKAMAEAPFSEKTQEEHRH